MEASSSLLTWARRAHCQTWVFVHHMLYKCIPTWVLPDSMLPPHQLQDHEELSEPSLIRFRDKTRPDVMIVELTLEEQRTYCNAKCNAVLPYLSTNIKHSCKRRRVWMLEVGYNSNTKYEEKFQEKTQQHQALVNALTQWGYDVHLRPLPLGFAGTIYKSTLRTIAHHQIPITKCAEEAPHTCNHMPTQHH